MKCFIALLLLAGAIPASAQVTCKENVMTTNRFCSSKTATSGNNYYFLATNDTGTQAYVLFSFGGLISSARPDGVMVKLDAATPFKTRATATPPDVNCRGGCRWSVGAAAEFTNAQFNQIAAASKMLVSFTQGEYVSEPIEVDPRKIGSWFQEWRNLTKGAAAEIPDSPPSK